MGDAYYESARYKKATELYQYVLDHWPDHGQAMRAQKNVAKAKIALGDTEAAEAAFYNLLVDFSGHKDLPAAVRSIADSYRESGRYQKARQLYQFIMDRWPEDEGTIHAYKGLAMSNVGLGDDPRTTAAIKKLLADFSGHKGLPVAVRRIADSYHETRRYEEAKELYQFVLDRWPEDAGAIHARKGVVISNVGLGDQPAAQAALDKLIADFTGHVDLPLAVWRVAEVYYNQAFRHENEGLDNKAKGYFAKVISLGQAILQRWPASVSAAEIYLISAECYRRLGQYAKAIEYFQKVVDDWPDYKYACNAQCIIGECYEKLRNSGALPQSEANPLIEQAYQAVIEKYPDCSLAGHAHLKLSQLSFEMGQLVDAVKYYELFLENYPQDTRYSQTLYHLARTYEKMGELDRAVEIHRIFLEIAEPGDRRIKTVQARLARLQAAQNDN
ncbi:MAG: tetratricopeptide repeat protein [Sedimentisphaerales bacterium]